jgi:NRAMP (natural resistance-associated macrophage protein)-like metal ion transporter
MVEKKKNSTLRRFFSALGPGLVTGAADDDPSGIATYSIAGAQLGTSLLWMAWVTWPLMAAVQMMCARIGMVTGQGLAGALSKKIPKSLLIIFCFALLIANIINIAADLAGMADAAQLLTGLSSHMYVVIFGAGIGFSIVRFRYYQIANTLKWLALSLFAYVITAFIIHPDWSLVAQQTFSLSIPKGKETWETMVAILGTTISPYLFFWQAAQEVEEEKAMGRRMRSRRIGVTNVELMDRMMDVGAGTFLSNIVMFFIILTTALTLNAHGLTNITSSKEAAEALRPLAGNLAMLLYTVGIVAVGLLAIPTLAGSAAYAFAETFVWSHGLDEKLKQARSFYAVIILSVLCGTGLDFLHINPVSALFWSAVVNGLLAPFLLIAIFLVARDKKIMVGQPSSLLNQMTVAISTMLMFAAAIGMFTI